MRRATLLIVAAAVIVLAAAVSDSAGAQGSAEEVVLGGIVYGAPNGEGWGGERPGTIFNGGDPSGLISEVEWEAWGGPVARGHGLNSIFKPHGGYYRHQVTILLKATDLGRCEGKAAYLKLFVREPKKPGGPPGPWVSWSGHRTLCQAY